MMFNPVSIIVGLAVALGGGVGGCLVADKLKSMWSEKALPSATTKTGDAFDDLTTAAMLSPAAPYAAAAKIAKPFVERGTRALAREFAPRPPVKPRPKAKPRELPLADKSCECKDEETMRNKSDDAGFVSVGSTEPQKPSRNWRVSLGKGRFRNEPKPEKLYRQQMAEYKKAYAAWEKSLNEARAFDAAVEAEKKRVVEAIRRAKSQAEVDKLKQQLQNAQAAPKIAAKPNIRLPKEMVDAYRQVAKSGTQPNPNVAISLRKLFKAWQAPEQPSEMVNPWDELQETPGTEETEPLDEPMDDLDALLDNGEMEVSGEEEGEDVSGLLDGEDEGEDVSGLLDGEDETHETQAGACCSECTIGAPCAGGGCA